MKLSPSISEVALLKNVLFLLRMEVHISLQDKFSYKHFISIHIFHGFTKLFSSTLDQLFVGSEVHRTEGN